MHNRQFEYVKQFWKAYPENRKFFRTHFSEAHDISGELIQYADEDFRDFLQFFYESNYLEDTFVTILSDHGAHSLTLRLWFFPDNSRYVENHLPLLFHVTKNDIPEASTHFLAEHEQSFIGSHDIYSTLKSIAENKISKSPSAESYAYVFEPIPDHHDCSNSTVYISDCWCSQDLKALEKRIQKKSVFYTKV